VLARYPQGGTSATSTGRQLFDIAEQYVDQLAGSAERLF
jgi:hypothetical protein